MKTSKHCLLQLLVTGLILSVVLVSCKKDNTDEPAPQLPPEGSFVMDFSGFTNPDDTTTKETASYINWGHSYVTVAVWSTIIKVGMAVPVAAFKESFNHEAVYHPDENNWTWSYNFTAGGTIHEAELTGFIVNDTVNWEMRITKAGQYNNFLWYSGKNSFDRSGGYWILYENPSNANALLRIDWTYSGQGIGNIRYTNIKPQVPETNSYIYFGTATGEYDRFYDMFSAQHDNTIEVRWNHEQHDGRVRDPWKFSDNEWHCWDVNLQDMLCP